MPTYEATPIARQINEKLTALAGMAAAMASVEYHIRNVRSMKLMIVHDMVEMTNGSASVSTSRTPQGRDHHDESRSLSMKSIGGVPLCGHFLLAILCEAHEDMTWSEPSPQGCDNRNPPGLRRGWRRPVRAFESVSHNFI